MLRTEDVLEILSIPLLGIIPESQDVLKASNVGCPVTLADPPAPPARAYMDAVRRLKGEDGRDVDARREEGPAGQAVRTEGRVSVFNWFRPKSTAPVARERLKMVLAHERVGNTHSQLIAVLQEEIIAVIAKHMQIDRDKVSIKLDRDEDVNTLEIDIEMPSLARA